MTEAIRQGDIPGVQLRCRQALPLAAAEAWPWITEPASLEGWLADRVVPFAEDGFETETEFEGEPIKERAVELESQAPDRRVLAFRRLDAGWEADTRLTLELFPAAHGSELSVLQQGFEQLSLSTCLTVWEAYRRRWRQALARLAAAT